MRTASLTLLAASLVLALGACSDDETTAPTSPRAGIGTSPTRPLPAPNPEIAPPDKAMLFHGYVAIGTSISMGTASDGVLASSQQASWPAQLAALAGGGISLPLVASPGCRSPLVAPIAAGVRVSGEAAGTPADQLSCAPNVAGVALPAQDVAINAATAYDALNTTPQNTLDAGNVKLYSRVLPTGKTQVQAMMSQHPAFVSIELGANELLGVRNGVYIPGVTVVPYASWLTSFRKVLDSARKVTRFGVVVGLVDHTLSLPGFRRGGELWVARATFAPFNVQVSTDCAESQNVLFVPVRVPVAVAQGVANAKQGKGPYVLSCQNAPSFTQIQDYVLDPTEIAALDLQLRQMNDAIAAEARAHGFATFALSALYDQANKKAPFDAVQLMTSATPYGPLVSLDGVHPSGAGSSVLATAAWKAVTARYGMAP